MYADTDNIVDLITRMRHLGVTPVFITNDPTTLPDELYANIDNIVSFLFKNEKEIESCWKDWSIRCWILYHY